MILVVFLFICLSIAGASVILLIGYWTYQLGMTITRIEKKEKLAVRLLAHGLIIPLAKLFSCIPDGKPIEPIGFIPKIKSAIFFCSRIANTLQK